MKDSRFKIAVSGAARVSHCAKGVEKLSKEVGREIARQKCILITGATTGVPYFSAQGCKEKGGFSVGFSPATSEAAHLKTYRLPIDAFDIIIYTGFDYSGRNLLMTNAADGVIIICGRMGTLNEFTTAFEDQKPIGVLEGSGGTADKIKIIATDHFRGVKKIVYDRNPKKLVRKLIALIKKEKKNNPKQKRSKQYRY
ncbi:MAG: hypothetical protein COY72_00455 [Candidatus Nealsonbacteria bacterium CG_4_10_14_0_8_um_filter_35_10]|uniref:Protein containing YHS domain protein n=2 Tax=Candidatus Nealsoniibacteriota TaxID=1817911 RepID=A0A2M7R889_9BACT|nr:MAG: hypothetical protein AUJ24_00405 [Parcubacteria group bacterium CG1_02_36_42]PIY91006.1 MAG: hypothetical protein COY72_00455 [Candidatus Nealsonbacteria bacterium CG_4_10_14_0_8_um_filter_35_10]PJB99393.1 MAG: hypothetical protein CO077_01970 [Candidatus Nealsonbacteria bacterium CG_4_9_14_0_8_um_filter_35_12]